MRSKHTAERRAGYWRRILRPLYWWLLLVLALYGIRLHQRLMEQTRIGFAVTLNGSTAPDAVASLDGKPVDSGTKISLGHHTFTIHHPKTEPFIKGFFAWYGPHDFGKIHLQRSEGTLSIRANPPAATITVVGPDFSITLTNCSTTNLTVPTDIYTVLAEYPHWSQPQNVSVLAHQTAACTFRPQLGAVLVSCNRADATGQLLRPDGQMVETVTFPFFAADLPTGDYKFVARHNGEEISRTVGITAGNTNTLALDFSYGSLTLDTEPSGATVRTSDGQYWGVTPLKLAEVKPGSLTLNLQHNGCESVTVSLVVAANQATTFQTNLVVIKNVASASVSQSTVASENTFSGAQNENQTPVVRKTTTETVIKPRVTEAAKPENASAVKSNDSTVNQADNEETQAKQRQTTGLRDLEHAKVLASQGNYAGAVRLLSVTIKLIPDNQEAKSLMAECQQQAESKAKPVTEHGKKPVKNTSP